ncbi:MAG TPA: adenosine-specific kinase [Anaerolineales bacterium]|nr:adenosine-specific kinase [Anaerolineales bacterium]
MDLIAYLIEKPPDVNLIIGQAHFIKSVEDIHEAIVNTVPGVRFGLAFCEASGDALVRFSGTSQTMTDLAKKNARGMGAGHSFIVLLENAYPINVLNAIQAVPEVCTIFCATSNPVQVILAETDEGRGILGVVDGCSPKGIEGEADQAERKSLLRRFGYKF